VSAGTIDSCSVSCKNPTELSHLSRFLSTCCCQKDAIKLAWYSSSSEWMHCLEVLPSNHLISHCIFVFRIAICKVSTDVSGGGILEKKAAVCLLVTLVPTCGTAAQRRNSRSQYRSPLVGKIHIFYVTVEVKFALVQATKANRGSRGIAVLFL